MKKTSNITIGGRLFAIEEDAYERLHTYLSHIKTVFAHYPDTDEIIADIEDRMADHFESQGITKDRSISREAVETLITAIGSEDDLRSTTTNDTPPDHQNINDTFATTKSSRKLYRNPDDKIIFGVCSGIAAYCGVDTVFVRLFFIIFTLFGGSGIIIYIILAIIIPEAKTMTEKMAMRGEPITLSNVVNQVKAEFTDEKNEARITAMKRAVNDTSQKIFTNPPHTIEHGIVRTLERLSRGMITIVKRFFSFLRNL